MTLLLRSVILALVLIVAAVTYFRGRAQCSSAVRLPLDFAVGLYFLTYFLGAAILFLLRTEYLFYIFGAAQFLPTRTSYDLVLFVSVLPFFVVPLSCWAMESLLGPIDRRPRRPMEFSAVSVWLGAAVVVTGSLVYLLPILPTLLANGLGGMFSTAGLGELYDQRRAIFQDITWVRGGLIYTTLPAIATILLLWPARNPLAMHLAGAGIGLLALILNLGLFQIGPTLSFILSFVFAFVAISHGRLQLRKLVLPAVIGGTLLAAYTVIKSTGYSVDPFQVYIMRMPSALPYLIQYASEQSGVVTGGNFSLSTQLANYMYPELVSLSGWIATPQPAFVDTYFTFHPVGGVLALILVSAVIVATGRSFSIAWRDAPTRSPRTIFTAVVASPLLYYLFQVDFVSLFTSAYSAIYVLPPIVLIVLLNLAVADRRRPIMRQGRSVP